MNVKQIYPLVVTVGLIGVALSLQMRPRQPTSTATTQAPLAHEMGADVMATNADATHAAPKARILPISMQEAPPADDAITITVPVGGRQQFDGFGASVGNWKGTYQQLSPTERTSLSRLFWHDLKFNTLRLWFNTDEYAPTPEAHDLSTFKRMYVDSGIISDATKQGVTTLLLAPDKLPPQMRDGDNIKDSEVENYSILLADSIDRLKKEAGVTITATGIQNEPNNKNNGPGIFSPEQMVRAVKKLREELDERGLTGVKVIASETASVDDTHYKYMDALKADSTAWKDLSGVASHSYNMAATAKSASYAAGGEGRSSKEYWMTESSDNGPEEPGDIFRAVSQSARFLNDMNHRVTRWIHFLGFETDDPKDNATRIITYTANPLHTTLLTKYYTYQQLSDAFDVGAVFRASESSREGDMTWTYGKKPRIIAATAKNPDGSWSIGLTNFTADSFKGVQGWADDKWNETQNGHTPAQSFPVTIKIDEMKGVGTVPFVVHRSNKTLQNAEDGTATMTNGTVTVTVAPMEVVTLRSATVKANNKA